MTTIEPNSATAEFSTDRFIKAFIAQLVQAGKPGVPPRDPSVRRGFRKVVELIDDRVRTLRAAGTSLVVLRPWIEAGNHLRLSATGGVENWERALRSAQLTFTKVGNPGYEMVTFTIDTARAQSELASLQATEKEFVNAAVSEFLKLASFE
jgi:hypothetical protein